MNVRIIPAINIRLKKIRREKKITQAQLADKIFKSLPTVKLYDSGNIIPANTLLAICQVLEVDIIHLLHIQDKQNKALNRSGTTSDIFYADLISKYENQILALEQKLVQEEEEIESLKEQIKSLLNILDFNVDYSYGDSPSEIMYYYPKQGEATYIGEKKQLLISDNKELVTFTPKQLKEFLKQMKSFANFLIYQQNSTKNESFLTFTIDNEE